MHCTRISFKGEIFEESPEIAPLPKHTDPTNRADERGCWEREGSLLSQRHSLSLQLPRVSAVSLDPPAWRWRCPICIGVEAPRATEIIKHWNEVNVETWHYLNRSEIWADVPPNLRREEDVFVHWQNRRHLRCVWKLTVCDWKVSQYVVTIKNQWIIRLPILGSDVFLVKPCLGEWISWSINRTHTKPEVRKALISYANPHEKCIAFHWKENDWT